MTTGQERLFAENEIIPELDFEPGFTHIQKVNQYAAARRVTPLQFELLLFIAARTTSAPKPRPIFARIEMDDFRKYCGYPSRTISLALAQMEKPGVVWRSNPESKTHRGGYRVSVSALRGLPLRRPLPCRPRQAKFARPANLAALRGERVMAVRAGFPILQPTAELTIHPGVAEQLAEGRVAERPVVQQTTSHMALQPAQPALSNAELQSLRNGLQEILQPGVELPPSFCPIGLSCPYDPGACEPAKNHQEEEITDYPTTTEPARSPEYSNVVVEGPAAEAKEILDELRNYGATTLKAAAAILVNCRNHFPTATVKEVRAQIRMVATHLGKSTTNPIGVILTSVPEYFRAYKREPEMVHPGWSPVPIRKAQAVARLQSLIDDPTDDAAAKDWARAELKKLTGEPAGINEFPPRVQVL